MNGSDTLAAESKARRAAALAVRVGAVKDELRALQAEVAREEPFLGAFHAVNGLRQAQTWTNDCLVRLMRLSDPDGQDRSPVPCRVCAARAQMDPRPHFRTCPHCGTAWA